MSVTEVKSKFEAAKKAVSDCQSSIQTLQAKADQLRDNLPGLTRAVEDAGKAKVSALDAFALNSNKNTQQALKGARETYDNTQRKLAETHELTEATARALKKQESEFVRLNNACELVKRECWQAVGDEIKSAMPSEVFASVKQLQVVGSQTGQTRQWILDSLFQNPSSGEHQEIFGQLSKEHGID